MQIAYDTSTGDITRRGTRLDAADGEAIIDGVGDDVRYRTHHVVDGAVVLRPAPLPDPLDESRQAAAATRRELRDDPIMNGLLTRAPDEVFAWVEANVNDMAEAKELLKRLAAAVSWLLKQ